MSIDLPAMSPAETILRRILARTEIGPVRRFFISIIFPEFSDILGDLAELTEHVEL